MSGLCSEHTFYSAFFVLCTECLPSVISSPRVVDSSRAGVRTLDGPQSAAAPGQGSRRLESRPAPPLVPPSTSRGSSLACSLCVSARRGLCLTSWQLFFSFQNLPVGSLHHGGWHAISLIFPAYPRQHSESTTA